MEEVQVELSPKQEKRLRTSLKKKCKTLTLSAQLQEGSGKILLLTRKQKARLQDNKKITMRQKQIEMNKTHHGGFLVSLLSSLAIGVATALLEKAVSGQSIQETKAAGFYLKKHGEGFYLKKHGNRMYLRRGGKVAEITQTKNRIILRPTEDKNVTDFANDGVYLIDKNQNVFSPTEYNGLDILI